MIGQGHVLVTGATGNIGSEVLAALAARGIPARAASRDPSAIAGSVAFDLEDGSTWDAALEGADRLFLVRPPAISDVGETLIPFVVRARELGVGHVVFLSVAGAGSNRFVPHRAVEDHLRATSEHFTNLRPGFFAQNLQDAYRLDIVEDDRIYVPAGRSQVNWIDGRDIAEAAAVVFSDPDAHRAADYTLAGPGAVPWSEVTGALEDAIGRPIRYEPASVLGYALHLRRRGLPRGAIAVQTALHFLLRFYKL